MTTIKLDPGAALLLDALHGAGHAAYAVGGCVRDSLLGLDPHDWDLCTSALVGPEAAGFARQVDGFVGRVGAGTGDDLDAAGRALDHCSHDLQVLFDRECGRFARRANSNDAAGTRLDMKIDQTVQCFKINTAVFEHGGHNRDQTSGEHVRACERNKKMEI